MLRRFTTAVARKATQSNISTTQEAIRNFASDTSDKLSAYARHTTIEGPRDDEEAKQHKSFVKKYLKNQATPTNQHNVAQKLEEAYIAGAEQFGIALKYNSDDEELYNAAYREANLAVTGNSKYFNELEENLKDSDNAYTTSNASLVTRKTNGKAFIDKNYVDKAAENIFLERYKTEDIDKAEEKLESIKSDRLNDTNPLTPLQKAIQDKNNSGSRFL